MSIFDYFRWNQQHEYKGPNIKFGRYSDAFKDEVKQTLFYEAIQRFDQEQFLPSVINLLDFLRDDLTDNVQYDIEGEELFFQILQGSKTILGRCNNEKFVAISEIAAVSAPNVGLYRRLLDKNYVLKHNRFCLDAGMNLILKFDSFAVDASPKKLYFALKELAINADKYDDILIDEFEELDQSNTGKIIQLTDVIKSTKAEFLRKEIKNAFDRIDQYKGFNDEVHHAISYILLYCNYKLDYLVKPEGFTMELIERNHRLFFTKNEQEASHKNKLVRRNLALLLERTDDQLFEEFYDTVHTFGYTQNASHEQLKALINNELPKVETYISAGKIDLALDVMGYVAMYGLFHNGFPQPDVDMLSLFMHVMESEYYDDLGFKTTFYRKEQLKEKRTLNRIREIREMNKDLYPEFNPEVSILSFEGKWQFAHSFLKMLQAYDLHYAGTIS